MPGLLFLNITIQILTILSFRILACGIVLVFLVDVFLENDLSSLFVSCSNEVSLKTFLYVCRRIVVDILKTKLIYVELAVFGLSESWQRVKVKIRIRGRLFVCR